MKNYKSSRCRLRITRRITFLVSMLLFFGISAQEFPPIQNILPETYKAENQNWAISQFENKKIYVANNSGLLEFNGANWRAYPSPNETILRSVKVSGNRIYAGLYMEFGYWQENSLSELTYHSLSEKLGISHLEDEEFWNIHILDDGIIFQSLDQIYIYNPENESVRILETEGDIIKTFEVKGSIYFQCRNKGLFKIENGRPSLVSDQQILIENDIVNLFEDGTDLLVLTQENGFYKLRDKSISKWDIDAEKQLSKLKIYSAIRLSNGHFVLGSISIGVLHIDERGNLIHQINQNRGLQNNTVLSIYEDYDQNIWLALDNGISYLNTNSPFKVFKNNQDGIGSVYTTAIHDGLLYLGTNQGLFYKPLTSSEDFKIIENTNGQVWRLKVLKQRLFCGHDNGSYVINGQKADLISDVSGIWDIKSIPGRSDLRLLGGYDGLYIIEKKKEGWSLRNKIKGFDNSARYIEVDENTIFVNHEYKGVFHIQLNDALTETKLVTIDTMIKSANSGIIKFDNEVLFASREGILKYDKGVEKFVLDKQISSSFNAEEYISGRLVPDEKDNSLWAFTKSNLVNISKSELSEELSTKSYPLNNEIRSNVVEFENIINYKDDSYLLGTESGYILFDIGDFKIDDSEVQLESIELLAHNNISLIVKRVNYTEVGEFSSSENSLKFSYYSPEYHKYLRTTYQYKLEGLYEDWSMWADQAHVVFENLPPGEYTFRARSRLGDKQSQNTVTYSFTVKRPWYLSTLMLIAYGLGILLLLGFMHTFYKRYYKNQQNKLIEANNRKLELAKVQNEKDTIKVKNVQLEEDIKKKSTELATSTMSIVRKNELLTQIKDQLGRVKDKDVIAPVIKLIDKNLNHNDNWKLFKEAFDNVDREFLKTLKELHPKITPNDIKLCAYLRLNLTTKEIAPLFNISARSVEIKRYRLRKKLNLAHDQNLVNYVLDI